MTETKSQRDEPKADSGSAQGRSRADKRARNETWGEEFRRLYDGVRLNHADVVKLSEGDLDKITTQLSRSQLKFNASRVVFTRILALVFVAALAIAFDALPPPHGGARPPDFSGFPKHHAPLEGFLFSVCFYLILWFFHPVIKKMLDHAPSWLSIVLPDFRAIDPKCTLMLWFYGIGSYTLVVLVLFLLATRGITSSGPFMIVLGLGIALTVLVGVSVVFILALT